MSIGSPMTLDTDEALFVAHFLEVYPDGELMLFDVGAASGRFARGFSERCRPRRVWAHLFEPRPGITETPMTCDAVHWCALGSAAGTATFVVGKNGELSHIARATDDTSVADYCAEHGIEGVPIDDVDQVIEVKVSTVDHWLSLPNAVGIPIRHLDFLKIDTEGYELEVLRGARAALAAAAISAVQFEYGGTWIGMGRLQEAVDMLPGFTIYGYDGHGLVRRTSFEDDYTWSGNLLAIRE